MIRNISWWGRKREDQLRICIDLEGKGTKTTPVITIADKDLEVRESRLVDLDKFINDMLHIQPLRDIQYKWYT